MAGILEAEKDVKSSIVKKESTEVPNCLDLFYKWRFCASSSNQFHHYYIYGMFQDCAVHRQDMTNCIVWKTTKSEDARIAFLEGMKRDEVKFTSGSVWEKRENPSDCWR